MEGHSLKKTFCDACGKQCINSTTIIRIEVLHFTRDNKIVGDDDYNPIEICRRCTDKVREVLPKAFEIMSRPEPEEPIYVEQASQEARERPVR